MADGTEVSAQLLQPENFDHEVALEAMPMLDETWLEAWYPDACAMEQLLMEGMGDEFEAPVLGHEFEAPVLGLEAEPPQDVSLDSLALVSASTGQLSAEAPVFVPGQKSMAWTLCIGLKESLGPSQMTAGSELQVGHEPRCLAMQKPKHSRGALNPHRHRSAPTPLNPHNVQDT